VNDTEHAHRPDDTAPMTQPLPTLQRPQRETPTTVRWTAVLRRVGLFWPLFGISLVAAVVFVASVAYSSMNDVGSPVTIGEDAVRPAARPSSFMIVQVASQTSRAAARTSMARLKQQGFPKADILRSDQYRPLNPGYWVVYAGTYPLSAPGRAAAERDQRRLPAQLRPGSRIREIQPAPSTGRPR
jgi:hypothetical protein